MNDFLFEEGVNIAFKDLDNGHKKLISILELLLSIPSCNLKPDYINYLFEELEKYHDFYFVREEKLLTQIDYQRLEEHKESHFTFIHGIIHLKNQWLAGKYDAELAKNKLSSFIQQWLIAHHIDKKLDYVAAIASYQNFNSYKRQKKSKNTWLRYSSLKLSQHLSLSHRVFITALLPVVAVFFLCLVILKEYYQEYQNINVVLGLSNVIKQVNIVSHSLQLERGLSAGVLNENSTVFSKKLLNHRKNTDQHIKHFLWLLEQPEYRDVRKNINEYLINVKDRFDNLSKYRNQFDTHLIDSKKTYQHYSKIIESLFSVSEYLIHANVGSEHINDILAINTILRYKEFMGRIRAITITSINNNDNKIKDNSSVVFLFGEQNNTLSTFFNSANMKQKLICGVSCDVKSQQQKIIIFYQDIMTINDKNSRMIEWFKFMSGEVNQLDTVLNGLINEFDQTRYEEGQQLKIDCYLIVLCLSLFLLGAIFFSRVLNYSIISPIKKLTFALNGLSVGQAYIRFDNYPHKDDISSMQLAFERLRAKLLQADIYKTTVSEQTEELQQRKKQQDFFQELALKDSLTGAFNRYHFNAILQEEITHFTQRSKALSIMVLDIDYFKKINDTYGHGVGDEMLILFYQTCLHSVRSSDVVARIGGEEFAIIMPDTELSNAAIFAERLRNKVANLDINQEGEKILMTVSIGVTQWEVNDINAEDFLKKADKLLYQAKNRGRNTVVSS